MAESYSHGQHRSKFLCSPLCKTVLGAMRANEKPSHVWRRGRKRHSPQCVDRQERLLPRELLPRTQKSGICNTYGVDRYLGWSSQCGGSVPIRLPDPSSEVGESGVRGTEELRSKGAFLSTAIRRCAELIYSSMFANSEHRILAHLTSEPVHHDQNTEVGVHTRSVRRRHCTRL
jgi:hypothetical protein